jgi:hypothetical protein
VLDINGDGVDELLWGERLLSLDDGHEVIDYAPAYPGHSDVIIPCLNYKTGDWQIFTCREGDGPGEKRVISFREKGGVAWEQIEYGHMHDGWAANVLDGYGKIVMCMRYRFVPDDCGFNHVEDGIFYFDAYTGAPVDFAMPCRGTELLPLDLDGDGYHEFLVFEGERHGTVLNRHGVEIAEFPFRDIHPIRLGKILPNAGEQVMISIPGSTCVEIYGDADAQDGEIMRLRYQNGYLSFMQKLMATGYNNVGSHVACGV